MKTFVVAAALATASIAASPAFAYDGDYAAWACEDINFNQPAYAFDVRQTIYYEYEVLVEDAYGNVWLCVADGGGYVYENWIIYYA